jgi:dienelactone hydrolase
LASALFALAVVGGAGRAGGDEPLAFPPGPHPVGFRVFNHRDATRRLEDGALRPVQVAVWYPATAGAAGPELRYRDYVLVAARERTLDALGAEASREALTRYRAFLAQNGLPAAGIDQWLDAPMRARADVPAARGRFPVVLVAEGTGGAVPDQAALAELLASHGYVVATTPSPVRLGARMESDTDVPMVAEEQARDLEVALSVLAPRSMADAARVGVVGYSFGARPALLLAGRRPEVRALVSLDGGIGSAAAKGWLSPRALDRARLATPILHVSAVDDEEAQPDFELLASLQAAPRTLGRVSSLRHLDFITLGLASATLPALGGPDRSRAAALRAVDEAALAFLDAHVAGEPRAWQALTAGGTSGLLTLTAFGRSRPASDPSR